MPRASASLRRVGVRAGVVGVVVAMAGGVWILGQGGGTPWGVGVHPVPLRATFPPPGASVAPPQWHSVPVGHPASTSQRRPPLSQVPDIVLPDVHGKPFPGWTSITQPVVIVTVWASWCTTCMAEMPSKIKYIKSNPAIALVALNIDTTPEIHIKALKKWGEYPKSSTGIWWLSDPSRTQSYGRLNIANVPESFILNANREIVYKAVGPFSLTQGPAAEVLERLKNQSVTP